MGAAIYARPALSPPPVAATLSPLFERGGGARRTPSECGAGTRRRSRCSPRLHEQTGPTPPTASRRAEGGGRENAERPAEAPAPAGASCFRRPATGPGAPARRRSRRRRRPAAAAADRHRARGVEHQALLHEGALHERGSTALGEVEGEHQAAPATAATRAAQRDGAGGHRPARAPAPAGPRRPGRRAPPAAAAGRRRTGRGRRARRRRPAAGPSAGRRSARRGGALAVVSASGTTPLCSNAHRRPVRPRRTAPRRRSAPRRARRRPRAPRAGRRRPARARRPRPARARAARPQSRRPRRP